MGYVPFSHIYSTLPNQLSTSSSAGPTRNQNIANRRCSDVNELDGLDMEVNPIHPTGSRAPINSIQWISNTELGNWLQMRNTDFSRRLSTTVGILDFFFVIKHLRQLLLCHYLAFSLLCATESYLDSLFYQSQNVDPGPGPYRLSESL